MTATVAAAYPNAPGTNHDAGALITFAAQGAGTTPSARLSNLSGKGVKVVVDITAITGTGPTLTVTLRGYDNASGKSFTLLASAALNAVATTVLTVYPGAAVTANLSANDHLTAQWDISAVIAGTT